MKNRNLTYRLFQVTILVFLAAGSSYAKLADVTFYPLQEFLQKISATPWLDDFTLKGEIDGGKTLKVGAAAKKITFTLTGTNPPVAAAEVTDVTCAVDDATQKDLVVFSPADAAEVTVQANGKFSAKPVNITCTSKSKPNLSAKLIIDKIDAEIDTTTLTIVGESNPRPSLNLLKGQTLVLIVDAKATLAPEVNNQAFSISGSQGKFTIVGLEKTDAPINLIASNSGKELEKFPVSVGVANIGNFFEIGTGVPTMIDGKGGLIPFTPADFVPSVKLTYETDETGKIKFANPPNNTITGIGATPGVEVRVRSTAGIFTRSFIVKVTSANKTIKISGDNVVIVGGSALPLAAEVRNAEASRAEPQPTIRWEVETPTDSQYLNVQNFGTSTTITAVKAPSDENQAIRVVAFIDGQVKDAATGKYPIQDTFPIFVRGRKNVVDFKPITVRIDMLDWRTAKDLFGGRATGEYHIAKIRIVNNLKSSEGGGAASSILFFSDALEVRVALEKKCLKEKNGPCEWEDLNVNDIYYVNGNWNRCEPTKTDADQKKNALKADALSYCEATRDAKLAGCEDEFSGEKDSGKQKTLTNKCTTNVLLEYANCQRGAGSERSICGCNADDNECVLNCRFCKEVNAGTKPLQVEQGQWIPFRPFVYQVVANTHDRRADRSYRNLAFKGLSMFGAGSSFVTSFLVPNAKSDFPLFLEKYKNLFIPSLEKLFPDMREVQRQNIISEILPPVVEVPFGSDVSKYVFFPKKGIIGVLPNNYVRISTISSFYITVSVGIVQKGTLQQL